MAKLKSVPVVVSVMVLTLAWIPVSESLKKPVALARKEDQNGSVGEPETRCIEQERQALLKFKQHLHQIKVGFLSSWENENTDCCDWYGVQCSNESGHVTALDLSPSTNSFLPWPHNEDDDRSLRGNITSWLLELKFLTYLDLSIVDFTGNQLPSFIGALTQLRYLNLSYTEMSGEIPPQLANLSSLQVLDLGYNDGLTMTNMEWVSHLSSLRILDLTQTNMSKATDWIQTVTKLPYLTNLVLSMCRLPNITIPSSISLVNTSKSLAILDLSNNRLSSSVYQLIFKFSRSLVHLNLFETRGNGSIPEAFLNMSALEYLELGANELEGFIPEALGNMSTLTYLGLSLNKFSGSIPEALGNLTNLTYIDIGSNYLEGKFPKSLWNLCKLRTLRAGENNLRRVLIPEQNQLLSRCTQYPPLEYLDFRQNRIIGPLPNLTLFSSLKVVRLYVNQFNGAVPEAFGRLTHLEELDLSSNSLKGVISEAHLSKLSKLSRLDLSGNSLIWNITYDWVPPFKLDDIGLHSCKLGPRFPKWLQTQKDYSYLGISNAGISDSIPNWFWDISSNCYSMDLSANQIHGTITDSSFKFMGYPNVDLSSNELEGSIPHFMFKVGALDLSMNRFSKLDSLCNVSIDTESTFLDISLNQLSGDLPDCWFHFKELSVLVLANNKLSGKIPISIGSLTQITTMNLGSNSLSQELPSSLKRCTNLEALNVGENRLFGPMPTWIGESLPNLVILSLRSNHFFGSIPSNLCHLSHLSVLDLSLNNISGSIPKCLNNLTAMKARNESFLTTIDHGYSYGTSGRYIYTSYEDQVQLVWKGALFAFRKTLGLVRSIDLSSNKLTGEIPTEITELVELVGLNLSRNILSGEIPSKIGRLELLDGLDLSNNRLSGQVPSSLSQVDRLSRLDLSNNNLSGKIPISTQLQSFEVSSYSGNPQLCGAPLPKWCPGDEPTINSRTHTVQNEEDQDKLVTPGFYFSLGLGFLVGLWGFCGTLFFNKTWRNSAF